MKIYKAKIISKTPSEKHFGGVYKKTIREYTIYAYHYLTGSIPINVREYKNETISYTKFYLNGTYKVPELNKEFKYSWKHVFDLSNVSNDIDVLFDNDKPTLIKVKNPYPFIINEENIFKKMLPKFWLIFLVYAILGYIQFGMDMAFSDSIKEFNFFSVTFLKAHYLSQSTIYFSKIFSCGLILSLPFLYPWKMYTVKKRFKKMLNLLDKDSKMPAEFQRSKPTTFQFWFWWLFVLSLQIFGNFDFKKYQDFYSKYDAESSFLNSLNQQYNLPSNQELKSRITTSIPERWQNHAFIDYATFSLKNTQPVLFIIKMNGRLSLENDGCTIAEFLGTTSSKENLFVIGNVVQNNACTFSARTTGTQLNNLAKNEPSQLVSILSFQQGIELLQKN